MLSRDGRRFGRVASTGFVLADEDSDVTNAPDPVDYPRPQLRRAEWVDLCGQWQFAYDDDDRGLVHFQCTRQSLQPAAGCFAAHAGVHNAVSVPLVAQSLLQQGDPALSGLEAIAGTQAVAKHEDGTFRRRARRVGHVDTSDDEPAARRKRPRAN